MTRYRYDVEGEGLRVGYTGTITLNLRSGFEQPDEQELPPTAYGTLDDLEFEIHYDAWTMAKNAVEYIRKELEKHREIQRLLETDAERKDKE